MRRHCADPQTVTPAHTLACVVDTLARPARPYKHASAQPPLRIGHDTCKPQLSAAPAGIAASRNQAALKRNSPHTTTQAGFKAALEVIVFALTSLLAAVSALWIEASTGVPVATRAAKGVCVLPGLVLQAMWARICWLFYHMLYIGRGSAHPRLLGVLCAGRVLCFYHVLYSGRAKS